MTPQERRQAVCEVAVGSLVALVDEADADLVRQYKWQPHRTRRLVYAVANPQHERRFFMHRLIMDAPKGLEVDHRNHDGLDNRRENLRLATRAENARNQRVERGRSIYRGVTWREDRSRWSACIRGGARSMFLGNFITEIAAAVAYDRAAKDLHGEFATLNFPGGEPDIPDLESQRRPMPTGGYRQAVLSALASSGAMRLVDVSRTCGLFHATAKRALAFLCEAQLVSKTAVADGRYEYRLTAAGREAKGE